MRVLVLSNLFPTVDRPSGGVFVAQRIAAMERAGARVSAVSLVPRSGPLTTRLLRATGRDTYAMPADGRPFVPVAYRMTLGDYRRNGHTYPVGLVRRAAKSVLRAVDVASFDVIHAHGMWMAPAGSVAEALSRASGVPYVVSLHGSDVNQLMPRMPAEYADCLAGAAATVYVSERLRQTALTLGAPADRAHVVPNGVDLATFAIPREPPSRPTVAFVGNLYEVKGADRLPALFRGVAAEVPGAVFRVVGAGGLRPRVERETRDLSVVFTGRVPPTEVAREMARADVLVAPSRNEGWPCVVLEAYASGTPVVGTAVGGMADAIGDPAFVVPDAPDPVPGLVDRVVAVLRGDLPVGDLAARAAGYGWDETTRAELSVLRAAAKGAG